MTTIKYIFRLIFFLLTVLLLVHINKRSDDNAESIAEFKFKMFEQIRADSLDSKHKLDLLMKGTTKFIDESSQVKEGIHYLTGLFGLVIVIELVFLILEKRNYRRQEIK